MSSFALVTLVNDRALFTACRDSLQVEGGAMPRWLEVDADANGWNAAQGLNFGLEHLDAEWVVCLHQDVLLPADFWARFTTGLGGLPAEVALAGVVGCQRSGAFRGHIVDPNGHCFWGPLPGAVLTLDEVLIAVRKSSGLRFCEQVPGFHCYGADLCLQAAAAGLRTIAVDAPIVHRSTGRIDARFETAARWLLGRWGEAYDRVIPTPTLMIADEDGADFWRRLWIRWQRRRDRQRRNANECREANCAARALAAARGEVQP